MNIEPATTDDAPIIVDLIIQGVKEGSFEKYTEDKRDSLILMMEKVITDKTWPTDNGMMPATITVIKRFEDTIGFCWTHLHTNDNDSTVIKAMAVKNEYRGKGNGKKLIDHVLKSIPPHHMVMATCTPEAQKMFDLLVNRKFEYVPFPDKRERALIKRA